MLSAWEGYSPQDQAAPPHGSGSKMKAGHPLPQGPAAQVSNRSNQTGRMRDIPLALQRAGSKNQILPTDHMSPKFGGIQPICFMSNAQDFKVDAGKKKSSRVECSSSTPCLSNVLVPSSSLSEGKRHARHAPAIQRTMSLSSLKPPTPPSPLAVLPPSEQPSPFSPQYPNCIYDNERYEAQASPTPHGPKTPSTTQGSEASSSRGSWAELSDKHEASCDSVAAGTECDDLAASNPIPTLARSLRVWRCAVEHAAWRQSRLKIMTSRTRLSSLRTTMVKLSCYAHQERCEMRWIVRGINKYANFLARDAFNTWREQVSMEVGTEPASSSQFDHHQETVQRENAELQALVHRHIKLATSQEAVISNLRARLSSADGEFFKAISEKQEEIGRLHAFAATDAQQLKRLQRKMVEDSGTIRELRKKMEELRKENKTLQEEAVAAASSPSHSCSESAREESSDCEVDLVGRCAALRASLKALAPEGH